LNISNKEYSVIIFGASGMVGKGVLLECLESGSIDKVLVVGRATCGIENRKLKEILHENFLDFSGIKDEFQGYDACFFCLGVSVIGLSEEKYRRITYDFTIQAAKAMIEVSPDMSFCYVSGMGTDSTEKGRTMWARVKGKTENAILEMGFKGAFMFRPGYIQPKKGVRSKVWWYQSIYDVFGIFYPLVKAIAPSALTSSDRLGKAMINAMIKGYEKNILVNMDINHLAEEN
jgi:hypothetical protein